MLRLPDEFRPLLKRPLGELFPGTEPAVKRLKQLRPSRLIAVGDFVAAELLAVGIKPDVAVIDFKIMRGPADDEIKRVVGRFEATPLQVKNPAGTITQELRKAFGVKKFPSKIIVDGEEDLATIPAVLSSPLGSVVVYGQPGEGMVLVEVTKQKRREFEKLIKLFKLVR